MVENEEREGEPNMLVELCVPGTHPDSPTPSWARKTRSEPHTEGKHLVDVVRVRGAAIGAGSHSETTQDGRTPS